MGMFDKDREYGNTIDRTFGLHEQFVIYGARITGDTITTKLGAAEVAELQVARLSDGRPGPRFPVTTIASAIVSKVAEAEPSDFPAVVELRKVASKQHAVNALVLQFVAPFTGEVHE